MYSSLDRADIVVGGKDGRKQYVQTDHRSAAEIEAEPELSVVFALVRVLNPKRMREDGGPEPVVVYSAAGEPPAFLRRAIRAAGGLITIGQAVEPEADEDVYPPLEEVVAGAFADLARAVAAEFKVGLTADGVEAVEEAIAEGAPDPEDDEVRYWSAVVKLGALAGEAIRASNGGAWRVVDSGTLPFALVTTFEGGEGVVNPLGKAIKLFENGPEDSVAALVGLVCRRDKGGNA
jgi:hypothetical protein